MSWATDLSPTAIFLWSLCGTAAWSSLESREEVYPGWSGWVGTGGCYTGYLPESKIEAYLMNI